VIQILTVRDEKQRMALCQKAKIPYTSDLHIIANHNEQGEVREGAIFKYEGDYGEILWLDMGDDIDLADGLGKSILSIMELRGVKKVIMPGSYDVLAQKLRFQAEEDHFAVYLEGYFCCGCQHK